MISGKVLLILLLSITALSAAEPTRNLVPKIRYRLITNDPAFNDYRPAFSPDGKSVVFEHNQIFPTKTPVALHLVDFSGANLRPLLSPDFGFESTRAAWSRQTGLIAFAAQGHGITGTLWTVRPDGGGLTHITSPRLTTYLDYPHWYFQGLQRSLLLVDYEKPGNAQSGVLKKVTLDPKNSANPEVEFLTDPATFYVGEPSISPDGLHVAMAAQPNTGQIYDQKKNRIWIFNMATRTLRKFDNPEGRAPTFSPDGKWITFESNRGSASHQNYAIFAKRFPRGRQVYQLTPYSTNSQHNIWSNDGRYIMCSARLSPPNANGSSGVGIMVFRVPRELRKAAP